MSAQFTELAIRSLKTKQKQRQLSLEIDKKKDEPKRQKKIIWKEEASEELESISNGEFDPGSG